jgi:hypothetical protein
MKFLQAGRSIDRYPQITGMVQQQTSNDIALQTIFVP